LKKPLRGDRRHCRRPASFVRFLAYISQRRH
jgi:hypothetical protein